MRVVLWEVGGRAGCGSRVVSFTSSSTEFVHLCARSALAWKMTRQADTCVTTRPLNPIIRTLCAGTWPNCEPPFSDVQHLYNEALVAQKTMQHVRSMHNSIHIPFTEQEVAKWLASGFSYLVTPLWHDAEGAGLNIVSVPRLLRQRGPRKFLQQCCVERSASFDSLEPH